jgi:hypothetical protein
MIASKSSEPQLSRGNVLRQRAGNQAVQQLMREQMESGRSSGGGPLRSLPIQAKFTVSEPGDAHEREADHVADAVMRMPANEIADKPIVASNASPPDVQRMCTDCDEEQKHKASPQVQRKAHGAATPALSAPVAANIQALRGGGSALPAATRALFEPRFGADFSNVRVHTGTRAEEAAASISAKAFTVGNDIAFGSGQYSPASPEGQKLLAHELTHTVQQGAVRGDCSVLQRQPKGPQKEEKPTAKEKPKEKAQEKAKDNDKPTPAEAKGPRQQVYVVRDKKLWLGGTLVSDLEDFKRKVMATKIATDWTLVLSIHGSQDLLAAQAEPDWDKNKIEYQASDIDNLFKNDKDFVKWRNQYGPTHLSLVSCQVSASFEGTLISNLQRSDPDTKRQPKRGLGAGCKPIATKFKLNDAPKTRANFEKLPQNEQDAIRKELRQLNDAWGYYGAPPVAEDQLLHFYYDEDPKGAWVKVEVMVGTSHIVSELKQTDIPYWNRTTGPKAAAFRRECDQGVDTLKRGHTPRAPDVSE